jgi:hypothetical protein
MITVVIPTMWRYAPLLDFVGYIARVDVVEEIIIINNDNTRTPDHAVLSHPKVRLVDFGHNIFVNPAWNWGVNHSKSDKVCILNDDCTFDLKLLYRVDEFLTEDMGSIGLSAGRVDLGQTPLTNGAIDFEPFAGQACYGWGNLMFVHKKHWRDIPAGLDIWFGDVFIFDYPLFNGRQNYFITNMFHHHAESQTLKTINVSDRFAQEQVVWDQVAGQIRSHTL